MDTCWRFVETVRKKNYIDISLFLLFLVLIAVCFFVDVFHILPYIYRQPTAVWWMMTLLPLTFVVFNLMANFIAIIFADSSILGRSLPLSTSAGILQTNLNNPNILNIFFFFQKIILHTAMFANVICLRDVGTVIYVMYVY